MEMKSMLEMVLPTLVAVTALVTLAFGLAEGRGDERAALHRYMASRAAFLLGLGVLAVGTLWQTYTHTLDYWLLGALIAATLGKIVGLLYGKYKY
jgi:ABC-type nitrate/sulfonate/bicarbonate transport system permease component